MLKKLSFTLIVSAFMACFGGYASGQEAQDIIKSRVEGLRELGAAFKNVNDELKSSSPQIYIIQLSARQIRTAAKAQYDWFPEGSGPLPGRKTKAKAEIWTHPDDFKTAQDAFAAESEKFTKSVAAGDFNEIRAEAKQLGQTCGGCHRTFRVDDKR
jgi:cytochrome c556